jgi:N-methylhydantoinase B
MEAPDGTIVNPTRPASVGSRHLIAPQVVNAITTALHEAAPDRVPASGGAAIRLATQFFTDGDESKILSDGVWGAAGARPDRDGNPAVSFPQNVNNTPVEVIEVDYPVLLDRYELVPDTAGAGTYRGGNATVREYEFQEPARIQLLAERFLFPPSGLDGGLDGATGSGSLNPGTDSERSLQSKELFDIETGDVLQVSSVGGGGFGDPSERDPEAVRRDVENGLVTEETAKSVYGVEDVDHD